MIIFYRIVVFFLAFTDLFYSTAAGHFVLPAVSRSGAYLYVHFVGNDPTQERVSFAVSRSGYDFSPLNGNQPVITQTLGTGCVRDPYILRGEDGYFYIIGTDMRSLDGWTSNHCLISWKSSDLIHWTDESLIDIRDCGGEFAHTDRAWAPQAVWDAGKGAYMVYWANSTAEDDTAALYYAYTTDFKTITKPQLLYKRAGIQTIDGDIIYNKYSGFYYLYFKHDEDQTIAYVKSKSLTGPYEDAPVVVSLAPSGVEGSSMYNITGTMTWVMLMDEYGAGRYFAQQTVDMEKFRPLRDSSYSFKDVSPRHGSVVAITSDEYTSLVSQFGLS